MFLLTIEPFERNKNGEGSGNLLTEVKLKVGIIHFRAEIIKKKVSFKCKILN